MMGSRRTACVLAALVAVHLSAEAGAQEDPGRRVAGSVRLGTEYDDNVFRREGEEQHGGFLSRYFAALDLATRGLPGSVASLSVSHGGKFFFLDEHGGADTLLTQVTLGYRQHIAAAVSAWASADMKDRTERDPRRDYNLGGVAAGVELYTGPVTSRFGGAARYFAFKPSSESSSSNLEGLAQVRWRVADPIEASGGYTLARRAFDTDRYDLVDDELFAVPDDLRRDLFHMINVGVSYRGPLVGELRYAYARNVSNSYGQRLSRHSFNLTLTAPLLWRFFASVHLELQRTTYQDPVLIDASFLVDEDNRNAVVASLVRAFGEHWEVEARYSLYLQEFGVGSDYRRQTILAAVGYLFD